MTLLFTTSEWINSIATIAALLTAIITLFTVIEIRKQREHSYHPEINVANFQFYVYRYDKDLEEDEDDENTYLYYTKNKLEASVPKRGYNELTVDVNNIGLGVAKRVFWEWEIDIYELCKSLQCRDKQLIKWFIDNGDLNITVEKVKVDWIFDLGEENLGGYFNFVLPYSIENRKNEIKLPSYFLDLFWLYKIKTFLCENEAEDKEYPPMQLHISYTDMHGKEIRKTLLIYLEYSFISNPLIEQPELALFRTVILEAA
ncbi:MAG: hypothetical protein EOP48_27135 [Sphingobacteriales bacterium]|nr:MAG: hypothetical protein EOP48_27135 [Sphingobacteriales bacterium]